MSGALLASLLVPEVASVCRTFALGVVCLICVDRTTKRRMLYDSHTVWCCLKQIGHVQEVDLKPCRLHSALQALFSNFNNLFVTSLWVVAISVAGTGYISPFKGANLFFKGSCISETRFLEAKAYLEAKASLVTKEVQSKEATRREDTNKSETTQAVQRRAEKRREEK